MSEPWITQRDAAAYVARSYGSFRHIALLIPHGRNGRRLLFRKSALDRWVATNALLEERKLVARRRATARARLSPTPTPPPPVEEATMSSRTFDNLLAAARKRHTALYEELVQLECAFPVLSARPTPPQDGHTQPMHVNGLGPMTLDAPEPVSAR